jgi:hypothetical protein
LAVLAGGSTLISIVGTGADALAVEAPGSTLINIPGVGADALAVATGELISIGITSVGTGAEALATAAGGSTVIFTALVPSAKAIPMNSLAVASAVVQSNVYPSESKDVRSASWLNQELNA